MFFFLHILFMSVSALLIIAGVCTAIFLRRKKTWLTIHRSFNVTGLIGMLLGMGLAFLYVNASGNKHIGGLHQITGLSTMVFVSVTAFLGFHQFRAKNKTAWRTTHRWFGRFSLGLLIIALILGLMLINIL